MESGIYLGRIDQIRIVYSRISGDGTWYLFELRISIRSGNQTCKTKFIVPSWLFQDVYAEYFKSKHGNFKQWRQLTGKPIQVYWDEEEDPLLIKIMK